MTTPAFVREFLEKIPGARVSRVGFGVAITGTVIEARVSGKRIRYEVLDDEGKTHYPFADELAHLGGETIQING